MAKHKMYRRRCYISGYIKKQQNFLKFYKKSIDFKDMLWYHNKCTEDEYEKHKYKLVKYMQKTKKHINTSLLFCTF